MAKRSQVPRNQLLNLLNSVGEGFGNTVPNIAELSGLSEFAVKRRAAKAVRQRTLTPSAENVWRGWLHLDGPVASHQSLLGEEAMTVASLPEPLPEEERVAMGDEPVTSAGPVAPLRGGDRKRRQTAVYTRLKALPAGAAYEEILRAYVGGRELPAPEKTLRHYAILNRKTLSGIFHTVVSREPPRAAVIYEEAVGAARALPPVEEEPTPAEPVTLPSILALENRLTNLEQRLHAMSSSWQSRMAVVEMQLDLVIEDLEEEPASEPVIRVALFVPRLTANTGARILKASQAFVRVLTGRESSGTATGEGRERR